MPYYTCPKCNQSLMFANDWNYNRHVTISCKSTNRIGGIISESSNDHKQENNTSIYSDLNPDFMCMSIENKDSPNDIVQSNSNSFTMSSDLSDTEHEFDHIGYYNVHNNTHNELYDSDKEESYSIHSVDYLFYNKDYDSDESSTTTNNSNIINTLKDEDSTYSPDEVQFATDSIYDNTYLLHNDNYPSSDSYSILSNLSYESSLHDSSVNMRYNNFGDSNKNKEKSKTSTEVNLLEATIVDFISKYSIPLSAYNSLKEIILLARSTSDEISPYTTIINRLKSMESMKRHQYRINTCRIGDNTFNVRVYPFLENIKWLLQNKELMEMPLLSYDNTSTSYDELNTGLWWYEAEKNMNERVIRSGSKLRHVLIPVILFIDKTHCSTNGTLSAEPVLVSIGNIPLIHRKSNTDAWFNLGFIPEKKLTQSEIDYEKKGKGCRVSNTERYHAFLLSLLSEFKKIQDQDYVTNMGIRLNITGIGNIQAHFELAMVIGDCLGNDQLCCHYKSYSKRVHRPMRQCYCSYDQLDDHTVQCSAVDAENLEKAIRSCIYHVNADQGEVTKARDLAKVHSQELHISSLSQFKFGGCKSGIYGSTPVEILHALLLGIMKYVLICIFKYSVVKEVKTKQENKELSQTKQTKCIFNSSEFEKRIRILSRKMKRQSVRDLPYSSFSNGVCTLSGLSGQEYVTLSILTIAALPGCLNLNDITKRIEIEKDFSEVLWMGVSLYELFNQPIPKSDISLVDQKIRRYIERFVSVCGEQRRMQSVVGTKLQKLHSLIHLPLDVQKYASALNFYGGHLESLLKTFVKHPAKRTRGQHGERFLMDVCNRWTEFRMINDYMQSMNNNTIDCSPLTSSKKSSTVSHKYETFIPAKLSKFQFIHVDGSWYTQYDGDDGSNTIVEGIFHPFISLDESYLLPLRKWVEQSLPKRNDSYPTVECYYDMRVYNTETDAMEIFRCSPKFMNEEWFDWCYVEFENSNDNDHRNSVPAQLFLIMSLRQDDILPMDYDIFALVLPLKDIDTPTYPMLGLFGYDVSYHKTYVIHCVSSFNGAVFVLPAVDPVVWKKNNWRVEVLSSVSVKPTTKQYYIAIPPKNMWYKLGWK